MTTTETKEISNDTTQVQQMHHLIESYKPQMQALFTKHVDLERMFRIACLAISKTPKLAQCTAASVLGAVLESARLGLEPGSGAGETWLIPYGDQCQIVIDYRGIIKLMRRGGIETIQAEQVCEFDAFEWGTNQKPYVNWKPARENRGRVQGFFAASWDQNDKLTAVVYRTQDEIAKIRARSKASGSGPWVTDYDAMARKTVIRQLVKVNPSSPVEAQRGTELDERAELGLHQNLHLLADPKATAMEDKIQPAASVNRPERTDKPQREAFKTDLSGEGDNLHALIRVKETKPRDGKFPGKIVAEDGMEFSTYEDSELHAAADSKTQDKFLSVAYKNYTSKKGNKSLSIESVELSDGPKQTEAVKDPTQEQQEELV